MSPEARAILLKMKGELSQGWIQGEVANEAGKCLYGGLVAATDLPLWPGPATHNVLPGRQAGDAHYEISMRSGDAITEVVNVLAQAAGVENDKLTIWNDAPERTQDEVIALIDKALDAIPKNFITRSRERIFSLRKEPKVYA